MKLSLKNRISLLFSSVNALFLLIIFFIIYWLVKENVIQNIDNKLLLETSKHLEEITFDNNLVSFKNKAEWEEREHKAVEINPVFLQLMDIQKKVTDKSPNLKEDQLKFYPDKVNIQFFESIGPYKIRQLQIPVKENGTTKAYIIAAMSADDAISTINLLKKTLFILYPIFLIIIFLLTRFFAAKSILPVKQMIEDTHAITKEKLDERLTLPQQKDELYELSYSFNQLLDRVEAAFKREKQFTSDASHQLRTPLAVIKGTLEVLNRKERSKEEYKTKIDEVITEINRMTLMLNQLLELARIDNITQKKIEKIDLKTIYTEVFLRYSKQISEKKLKIIIIDPDNITILSIRYLLELILDNIISNAVKYTLENGTITLQIENKEKDIQILLEDDGIGISKEDINSITQPFFRAHTLTHKDIKGSGLGLSIVKKSCDFLGGTFTIDSKKQKGTSIIIILPQILSKL